MESKSWLQSKGVWGGIIAGLGIVSQMFGYDLGPEGAEGIVNQIAALVGAALAIHGRIKAVKKIT